NIIFIQGIHMLTSYFLVFEGIVIIGMGLFSFFRLLLRDDQLQLYKYPHFWLAATLVFFWSFTFLNWSLYDYFDVRLKKLVPFIYILFSLAGIIFYCGVGCIFLLYPKMGKRY